MTSHNSATIAFYDCGLESELVDPTLEFSAELGLDLDKKYEMQWTAGPSTRTIAIPYKNWEIWYNFTDKSNGESEVPDLEIDLIRDIDPETFDKEVKYSTWMDVVFALGVRVSMLTESAYTTLYDAVGRSDAVRVRNRPFSDHIDEPPLMGVFSEGVLADLGGVDGLYESPWYTAELTDGRTVVIDAHPLWSQSTWEPPTEASFIERAEFRDNDVSDRTVGLSDPFGALETGEYGVDVGVVPDQIAGEFTNEALRVRRVRVDEERNLRRIDDNAFVRNIVDEEPADQVELIQEMLSDIPQEPNTDEHVSALLHEAVPPSFVRLESPDDENVVTKVMDLETDVNKHHLLLSLGGVAQQDDFTDADLDSIEEALDTLADLDGENVDAYIRQNLL